MNHGHRIGAFTRSSAVSKALARAAGTWGGYQAWNRLGADHRLELVERVLKTNDGLIDEYSLAL